MLKNINDIKANYANAIKIPFWKEDIEIIIKNSTIRAVNIKKH